MSLSVKYNGVELAEYISVLKGFTPYDSPEWQPQLNDSGTGKGSDFQVTYYKEKEIEMPFDIGIDTENIDELKKILNVSEPKPLIFGSVPDRVFYAIPSGNLDFEEMRVYGTGTIVWLVPDGVAYSLVEKTFQAKLNNGVMEATIYNDGTEECAVNYTIEHNHENGYIGIVSEYGAMQYGKIDEVDSETLQRSEELFRFDGYDAFSAMTNGQGVLTEDFPKNGTWREDTYNDSDSYLALNNVGSGSSWHGASKMITLPQDSSGQNTAQNFYCQTRIWFEAGRNTQTGLMEFVVGDEDGNLLASIHVVKTSTNNAQARVIMKIAGEEVERIEFTANGSSPVALNAGQLYIRKTGGEFEFYYHGKHTFNRPELASKKAKSVTIFVGQHGNRTNSVDDLVTRMYFDYLFFRKDNVNYENDIPNRYPAGTVLYINGSEKKIYRDGINCVEDEIVGTHYFKVPPGETVVQFYYSDFCNPPPTIAASITEVFL